MPSKKRHSEVFDALARLVSNSRHVWGMFGETTPERNRSRAPRQVDTTLGGSLCAWDHMCQLERSCACKRRFDGQIGTRKGPSCACKELSFVRWSNSETVVPYNCSKLDLARHCFALTLDDQRTTLPGRTLKLDKTHCFAWGLRLPNKLSQADRLILDRKRGG